MKIRKAVVTAAGWGTRFLPATKAQPKETLALVDKPMIQYVVEEAAASGIRNIIIITALGKRAIEDHFDRSFELEQALRQKGNTKLLSQIIQISDLANFCYIRQKEVLGLGHAILTAREVVGEEPFAVFLPDDIIEADVPAIQQLIDVYERFHTSVIAVEQILPQDTWNYGVIRPKKVEDRLHQVLGLIEKPAPEEAPSNLGIVGRYILTPEIFEVLERTPPGKNREIQLTDALARLLKRQDLYAYEFKGKRYDAGTPLGFLKAAVQLGMGHPEIGPEFRHYLRDLQVPLEAEAASQTPS